MTNPSEKKLLGFDFRYLAVYAAVFYFVEMLSNFLAIPFKFFVPKIVPVQGLGMSKAYLFAYPLYYLTNLLAIIITISIIAYFIESKRAHMFKGYANTRTLLLEQGIASLFLFVLTFMALINTGSLTESSEYLGGFLSYVFGVIDKDTLPKEIFYNFVQGDAVLKPYALWLIPLCNIITLIILNTVLYFVRSFASKKGESKRAAEKLELYQEAAAKRDNS